MRADTAKAVSRTIASLLTVSKRAVAARANMTVDVDHHLDARQMRRQRFTVMRRLAAWLGR
jgi:hypothetical protein